MLAEHHSLNYVAWKLGIPLDTLRALAGDPEAHYRTFEIKRRGKKPRRIDNPDDALKVIQGRIRVLLVEALTLPDWMHGCVKGKSPLTNAAVHLGQPNVASVDVKSFFPRVNYRMVYEVFLRVGLGPEPARLLTQLTTRGGHLPQGAPTSDRLANLHLATADGMFEVILSDLALRGTSYVDDITVSGGRTREAIPRLISMLNAIGLPVSGKKVRNAGARQAHRVTGYNTNGKTPTVSRKERSKIRATVHRFLVARLAGGGTKRLEHAVRSRLGQLRLTNPGEAARLHRQLRREGLDLSPKSQRAPKARRSRSMNTGGRNERPY